MTLPLADDAHRALAPWLADPAGKFQREVRAFIFVFVPTNDNNTFRKVFALGLLAIWGVMTLGYAPEAVYTFYPLLTAAIWGIIGRLWDIQLRKQEPGQ